MWGKNWRNCDNNYDNDYILLVSCSFCDDCLFICFPDFCSSAESWKTYARGRQCRFCRPTCHVIPTTGRTQPWWCQHVGWWASDWLCRSCSAGLRSNSSTTTGWPCALWTRSHVTSPASPTRSCTSWRPCWARSGSTTPPTGCSTTRSRWLRGWCRSTDATVRSENWRCACRAIPASASLPVAGCRRRHPSSCATSTTTSRDRWRVTSSTRSKSSVYSRSSAPDRRWSVYPTVYSPSGCRSPTGDWTTYWSPRLYSSSWRHRHIRCVCYCAPIDSGSTRTRCFDAPETARCRPKPDVPAVRRPRTGCWWCGGWFEFIPPRKMSSIVTPYRPPLRHHRSPQSSSPTIFRGFPPVDWLRRPARRKLTIPGCCPWLTSGRKLPLTELQRKILRPNIPLFPVTIHRWWPHRVARVCRRKSSDSSARRSDAGTAVSVRACATIPYQKSYSCSRSSRKSRGVNPAASNRNLNLRSEAAPNEISKNAISPREQKYLITSTHLQSGGFTDRQLPYVAWIATPSSSKFNFRVPRFEHKLCS